MKKFLIILFSLVIIAETLIVFFQISIWKTSPKPFKVGLVYSITGFRKAEEISDHQAALLAIKKINSDGGINGSPIQAVSRDAKSNWEDTEQTVKDLILNEQVDVIIGCWTKGSYDKLKELFEHHNRILLYPYQYEGWIDSPNIICFGITAYQQVMPTIDYCLNKLKKEKFFIIGSKYAYADVLNMMFKDRIKAQGGEIVAEQYLSLEEKNLDEVIQEIVRLKPTVILNSLIGSSSLSLFEKFREAGLKASEIPIFSFSLCDFGLGNIDIANLENHYAVWNYFESIDTPVNHQFVNDFIQFSGLKEIGNASEASYIALQMWAQAIKESGRTNRDSVLLALSNMRFEAPEGSVVMDLEGRHTWKYSRIGQIQRDHSFQVIWETPLLIRPVPYMLFRSLSEWKTLVAPFYQENPPLKESNET